MVHFLPLSQSQRENQIAAANQALLSLYCPPRSQSLVNFLKESADDKRWLWFASSLHSIVQLAVRCNICLVSQVEAWMWNEWRLCVNKGRNNTSSWKWCQYNGSSHCFLFLHEKKKRNKQKMGTRRLPTMAIWHLKVFFLLKRSDKEMPL